MSERIKGRLHWSSSPDRGLDNLLYILPWIREKVPEAHIVCYYGLNNMRKMNPPFADEIEKLIKTAGSDAIDFRGRIGQQELAKEWTRAHIWCYPTNFSETYCITAKEAQLSGTPVLATRLAALDSTVGEHGILIEPHAYSKDSRVRFIEEATRLMTDEDYWQHWSQKGLEGTSRIDWDSTYQDHWAKLLP